MHRRIRRELAVLSALFLFLAAITFAEPVPPLVAEKIDSLFTDVARSDAPGVAVAAIRDGEIVYRNAFGMADLERRVALTPDSVFEIGSVSKQFTAMSILLLEHDGKLSLDDDVRLYIPELPVYERPITLRHLLHHTSGIRDIETLLPLSGWLYPNYLSPDDQLELIARQRALNFPPGDEFLYSNSGYLLLAEVVERVSGENLRAFAEKRIFRPLDMRHTVFYDTPSQLIANRALPYSQGEDGAWRSELWYLPFAGPSGLYTNLQDLARWDANFYDNRLGGGAALIERMTAPGALANGEALNYAAGLFSSDNEGRRALEHGRAWMGFRAQMSRFPEERLTVILLANAPRIPARPREIVELILDAPVDSTSEPAAKEDAAPANEPPPTVSLSEDELAPFEGTYWAESDLLLRTIEIRKGALFYVRGGDNATELGALKAGHFMMLGVGVQVDVEFESPREGLSSGMVVTVEDEEPTIFGRLPPLSAEDLTELAGRYWSEELDRELRLSLEGGEIVASWNGADRRVPMITLGPAGLLAQEFVEIPWNPQAVRLQFERDASGRVQGMTMSCDMVRGLSFSKRAD